MKKKKKYWRYHHFTHVYQKSQSYKVLLLRYGVRQISFVVLGHFLPFTPSTHNNPENQNFEKMKKAFADVIKKHNHMMYAYSDME